MVAIANDNNLTQVNGKAGKGYDGVVRITAGGYYGTGVLLYDGISILTCAHLFTTQSPATSQANIIFTLTEGQRTIESESIYVHPDYSSSDTLTSYDIAILTLSEEAPSSAERYQINHDSTEINSEFDFLGYGDFGLGDVGTSSGNTDRLWARNSFDSDTGALKDRLQVSMGWTPVPEAELVADFDNGLSVNDALGQFLDINNLGLGEVEGIIASGDSGGPAFIDNKIAGVASYGASLAYGGAHPDIDDVQNNTFGEIGIWQRVSFYDEWIDKTLRASWADAPTQASEVITSIQEGDSGTVTAYFLLEIGAPLAEEGSVSYVTRDGTAIAGEDYLQSEGKIVLYPGETHAVIPIEILGDNSIEEDETFFLRVFDPVGGQFANNVSYLEAMRTIVDDDSVSVDLVGTANVLSAEDFFPS